MYRFSSSRSVSTMMERYAMGRAGDKAACQERARPMPPTCRRSSGGTPLARDRDGPGSDRGSPQAMQEGARVAQARGGRHGPQDSQHDARRRLSRPRRGAAHRHLDRKRLLDRKRGRPAGADGSRAHRKRRRLQPAALRRAGPGARAATGRPGHGPRGRPDAVRTGVAGGGCAAAAESRAACEEDRSRSGMDPPAAAARRAARRAAGIGWGGPRLLAGCRRAAPATRRGRRPQLAAGPRRNGPRQDPHARDALHRGRAGCRPARQSRCVRPSRLRSQVAVRPGPLARRSRGARTTRECRGGLHQLSARRALRGLTRVPALEKLLVRFSQLVVEQRSIREIDINPLLASPERLIALDARIVLHGPEVPEEELPVSAIRPYPMKYLGVATLRNGTEVRIRPIRPEDEPKMVQFHHTLSDQSVYSRYAGILKLDLRVAHERLARICFVDYDREMALVAERAPDGAGPSEIVAVARLKRLQGTADAEFALLVSDSVQRQGLGHAMLSRLFDVGRDWRLQRIVAEILPGNASMRRVCAKLGFTFHGQTGATKELH